ncbi:hypothetical protein DL93DRAFT_2102668 [Clavulina sp. PMI_390]|nr:hypothetical protein DL93DRAFT_2102668 [Clavulina sp. PMI_390]
MLVVASLLCWAGSLSLILHLHQVGALSQEIELPLGGIVAAVFLLLPVGWFIIKALEWNQSNTVVRAAPATLHWQRMHNMANLDSSVIELVNLGATTSTLPNTIPLACTHSPPSTISCTLQEHHEHRQLNSMTTEWSIKCIGHPFGLYANLSSLFVPIAPAPVANPGIAFVIFT